MVGSWRSRHRIRRGVRDEAPAPHSSAEARPTADSHPGFGWAVLGVALLLGLFFLVPWGLERSAAVVPTTTTEPVSPTPGPQTRVLSSTVALPGPATGHSEGGRTAEGAGDDGDGDGNGADGGDRSASLIIRVPVPGPTTGAESVTSATSKHSAVPRSSAPPATAAPSATTAPVTLATIATGVTTCPQATATRMAPGLAEELGGEFGSTAGGAGGQCGG